MTLAAETIQPSAPREQDADRGETLATLFAEVCRSHGSRTAVSLGEDSLTYLELDAFAERVAAALRARGVGTERLVAIYLERTLEMVAGMVGVVKAGAAYLPLETSYPTARVLETLADAEPAAILTVRSLAARLQGWAGAPVIFLEDLLGYGGGGGVANSVTPWVSSPDDLAYVIYTSGSTGKPKGVMVTQRNVVRLLRSTGQWFHFNERDVWTMFHSFAFDFSVWEMWGCLLHGGRLVLVPFAVSRSPEEFLALVSAEGVTVLNQTPSAFSLFLQAEAAEPRLPLALRLVIFGGEALNLRSLLPWFQRHSGGDGDRRAELVNMYGITETTVHVTYRRIRKEDAERETESVIGEAIPDLQIYLLDEQLRPVAAGETGEIWIGGAGVARGYLGRPELTAERFVPDPFEGGGGKLYRSGDLARRRADGELVSLGRADRQVKINGFRIELGEVEAALAAVPGVAQGCVTTHRGADGSERLAAYFVADRDWCRALDAQAIGRFLTQRLPAHMRPSFYTRLLAFPLTSNGKIDRAALPSPEAGRTVPAGMQQASPEPAESSTECCVGAAWRHALGREGVGRDENFFDVGGSSVLLIAVRTRLEGELNRKIPITWMFEHTTVRSLARKLADEAADGKKGAPGGSLPPRGEGRAQLNAQRQREAFARRKPAQAAKGGAR